MKLGQIQGQEGKGRKTPRKTKVEAGLSAGTTEIGRVWGAGGVVMLRCLGLGRIRWED